VLSQPRVKRLLSTDHFSVDGTLIEAWASMKSFRPEDGSGDPPTPGGGRNHEADFHGQRRSNETHVSTTDPEARLSRKGRGKEAKLCFMGHALMENRNGLVVDACLTEANGHAERIGAFVNDSLRGPAELPQPDAGHRPPNIRRNPLMSQASPHRWACVSRIISRFQTHPEPAIFPPRSACGYANP
jgi:hypothetical protein